MLLDNLKALKAKYIDEGMEKGIQKGIQKGIEKGMQKGIEKGIQKGIEKGREEMRIEEERKRDDGIRNMLKAGIASVREIATSFSLPVEHVLKIQAQIG